MANQVDFKILPSDQFSVHSPATRSEKIITYFTLLSKLRGDILAVSSQDDPNDIVSAYYSNVGGTQTLHLVKADGSEVTASQPQQIISGTVNYISKFTTSNDIGDSLLYDDGTNVGIGTTSMTHRLQLGTGGVFADYYQLDTTYSNGFVTGALSWDQDNGTMDIGLGGTLKLKVGQDDVWYVKNQTGSPIAKGVAVYANGTLGASGRITVAPMIANGTIPAKYFLGITAEAIANGADGYVLAKGKLRQIDTNAYNEGDVLWVSPSSAGALTATEPTAPNLKLPVAFVVYKANNGILAIRATTGIRIEDASDVNYAGASDNSFLIYNSSTGVWEDETVGIFKTVAVAGQSDIVADNYTDTLTVAAGTGITLATNASTDTLTITNSAPDQTVVLTAGTGITVSGTYPNFTITNSSPSSGGTVTSIATSAPITGGTITTTGTIGITQATTSTDGYLSSTDWNTFNSKASDAFKTIAVSGQSNIVADSATDTLTFEAGTNIVITTDAATDKITISAVGGGTGSVTSVDMTVPTGFAISGNPITSSGTLALAFASGYSLPTDASQTNWNTAYDNSITAFAYNTSTGVLTLTQQDAGTLTATVTLAPFTTTNLAEGTNLYFTTSRARQVLSAGTGISYDNSTGVITNSAPDQTVVLTAGTGISTSGTYPSFTIANTDPGSAQNIFKNIAVAGQSTIVADGNDDTLTVAAGTGITLTTNATSDTLTITNSLPDQTVVLTAGTGIGISGTYPSFTISNTGPTGSGTTNYVTKWTGTSVIGNSQIFDNGTNVGIGTATPAEKLQVNGLVRITNSTYAGIEYHNTNGTWELYVGTENGGGGARYNSASSQHTFYNNGSAIMRINSSGNVGIGTTSPSSKLHVAGTVSADAAFADSGAYRILKPNGGVRTSTSGTETGAIKITYPVGYTNTMHRVKLNVYEYVTNQSFTIYFGGYPYAPGTQWYNEFAYILNNSAINRNFTVRFGYDGTKLVVYIGELSSTWSYLQVFIEEIELGYGGMSDTWRDGAWSIGLEASAFQGVNATVSNTQATNWGRSGNNTYYSFGNVGIGTTSPAYILDTASAARFNGVRAGRDFSIANRATVRIDANGDYPADILFGRTAAANETGWNGVYWSISSRNSGSGASEGNKFTIWRGDAHAAPNNSESQFITITPDLNIGIGTTSPSYRLHLEGGSQYINGGLGSNNGYAYTSANRLIFNNDYNDIARGPNKITLYDASWLGGFGVHSNTLAYYSGGTHNWYQATTATDAVSLMTLTSTGSLGIGTTSPSTKLHVNYTTGTGLTLSNTVANLYAEMRLQSANSSAYIFKSSTGYTSYGGANSLNIFNEGQIAFHSSSSSNIMYLSAAGNVGFGTTAPQSKVDIVGVLRYGNNAASIGALSYGSVGVVTLESVSTNTSIGIIPSGTGKVGINTISPDTMLHVVGDIKVTGGYYDSSGDIGTAGQFLKSTGTGTNWTTVNVIDGSGTANYVAKWSDSDTITDSIIFDNGTDVGIGTATPGSKLDILSSANPFVTVRTASYAAVLGADTTNGYIKIGAGTNHAVGTVVNGTIRTWLDTDGNLGINTTSPNAKLNVFGTTGSGSVTPQQDLIHVGGNELGGIGGYAGIRLAGTGSADYGVYIRGVKTTSYGNYWNDALTFSVTRTNTQTTIDEAMRITSDSNVGIGTTSPQNKLHVIGNIDTRTNNSTTDTNVILLNTYNGPPGGGGTNLGPGITWKPLYDGYSKRSAGIMQIGEGNYFRSALAFYTNNVQDDSSDWSERMRITAGGNVGIGISTPDAKLEISGDVEMLRLRTSYPVSSARGIISWRDASNVTGRIYTIYDGSTVDMRIGSLYSSGYNSSDLVTIKGNGNFGIGTTAPLEKLHVAGNEILGDVNGSTIGYNSTIHTGAGNQTIGTIRAFYGFTNPAGYYVNVGDAWAWKIAMVARAGNSGNYNSQLEILRTTRDGVTDATTMAFSREGNVGIGETAPATLVHLNKSASDSLITSTPSIIISNRNSTSGSFIGGGIFNNTYRDVSSSSVTAGIYFLNKNSAGAGSAAKVSDIIFATGGYSTDWVVPDEKMRLTTDGNLGIGVSNPSGKLHVYGGSFITDLDATYHQGILNEYVSAYVTRTKFGRWNSVSNLEIYYDIAGQEEARITRNYSVAVLKFDRGGTTDMIINGSGNVGIGTTNPQGILHVTGLKSILSNYGVGSTQIFTYQIATGTSSSSNQTFNMYLGRFGNGYHKVVIWGSGYGTDVGNYFDITRSWGNSTPRIITNGGLYLGGATYTIHWANVSNGQYDLFIKYTANMPAGYENVINYSIQSNTGSGYTQFEYPGGVTVPTLNDSNLVGSVITARYSDGNVGIGTTAPSARFAVEGGSFRFNWDNQAAANYVWINKASNQDGGILLTKDNTLDWQIANSGGSGNLHFYAYGAGTTAMVISRSTANVGIGTTAPAAKLEVSSSIGNYWNGTAFTGTPLSISISNTQSGGYDSVIILNQSDSGGTLKNAGAIGVVGTGPWTAGNNASQVSDMYFLVRNSSGGISERMRITSTGNVGIGTTSPSYKLDVSGTIRATGDVIAYSDARVKENVETLDGALDKVMKMRGVSYNKIGEQEKKVGVIAQEILEVLPEVVSQDETGTYSVAYGNISAVLIEAIKELTNTVKEQQKQIDELKAKLK